MTLTLSRISEYSALILPIFTYLFKILVCPHLIQTVCKFLRRQQETYIAIIIESVDSISRDGTDTPYM